MNKDLIEFYEEEKNKIQREISDLWEVGKKSPKRTNRLVEIDYILDGLYANKEIEKLKFIKNRKNQGCSQENINKMAINLVNSWLKEVE